MTYKGKYKIKNLSKYKGDPTKVTYRSLWERQAFRWCDDNPKIVWWNSEEVVIPYRCATDGRVHRYFVDLQIRFDNGKVYCIEIKPEVQTKPPKKRKGQHQKKLLKETMTYAKNVSKWESATKFCEDRNWHFQIWTEKTLKSLGIKLLTKDK
jgi:hypothetical protein